MNRPRGPGLIFGVISLLLLVLISVFALTQRQQPPPTIAEFAPQAVESITDSPADQSSSSGIGQGVGAGSGGAGEPTPPPEPIDVPRVRRCVGDPPRQIEDPQAPPCVPYWAGNNGGATTKGVTRDEIRIAIPLPNDGIAPELERFFNSRFEFYGRQMRFKPIPGYQDNCDSTVQQNDAVSVDEQVGAFASGYSNSCSAIHYGQELARRKIIYVNGVPEYTENTMLKYRPYMWQYPMDADRVFANIGEWTCNGFVHRPARFAGDPLMQTTERKFGVLLPHLASTNYAIDVSPLQNRLDACGAKMGYSDTDFMVVEDEAVTITRLRDSGVTTVICLCEWVTIQTITKNATSQGYFPEWSLSTYRGSLDSNANSAFIDSSQIEHSYGLTFRPRQNLPENEPHQWAALETGGPVRDSVIYRSLLALASGIQMAGPRLTPAAFERGLQSTSFPNPVHPIKAGAVGFGASGAGNGPIDHSMTNDAAGWWWSTIGQSPYDNQPAGTLCYVEQGDRHNLGNWPEGDALYFAQPCDSGA